MTSDNAVLLEVLGPGTVDGYGDAGDGPTMWDGRASGYLKRDRVTTIVDGAQRNSRRDVFTILDTAGAQLAQVGGAGPDWSASKVRILDLRVAPGRVRTFTVTGMEHRQGGPFTSSTRVELDQEH